MSVNRGLNTGAAASATVSTATKKPSSESCSPSSSQQPRKPTTLAEVDKCIDEHPEVVTLEKELEKLINEMTSM